jgi:hypothetical protein
MSNNEKLYPLTVFKGFQSTTHKLTKHTWADLADILTTPSNQSSKSMMPYYSIAEFKPNNRSSETLISCHAIILDSDDGYSINAAKQALDETSLNYVITTSWSHQAEKNGKPPCDRFRVVIPMTESITDKGKYASYYNYFSNKILGEKADPNAIGPERLHGFYANRFDGQGAHFYKTDGKFFNPSNLEIVPEPVAKREILGKTQAIYAQSSRLAVCTMLDAIDPDQSYLDWCRIGWAIHSNFINDVKFGEALFDLWSSKGASYDNSACAKYYEYNPTRGNVTTIRSLKRMASDNGWWAGKISKPSYIADQMRKQGWVVTDKVSKRSNSGDRNHVA